MVRGFRYGVLGFLWPIFIQYSYHSSLIPSLSQDAAVVCVEGLGGERSGGGKRSSSFFFFALLVFMAVYSEDHLSASELLETSSPQMYVLFLFQALSLCSC